MPLDKDLTLSTDMKQLTFAQVDNLKNADLNQALKTLINDPMEKRIDKILEELQHDRAEKEQL